MPAHPCVAVKRPGLALLLFLAGAQALAGQTGLPSTEKAAENFPLSLQGFFGQGGTAEAGLRLRDSGKSAWVKPGESGGATPAPATGRKYTKGTASIVFRRTATAYRKHPEIGVAFQAQMERSMDLLALSRPDLVDPKTGKINTEDAAVRQCFYDQWRQFLTESTEPGIVAIRDGELALLDAEERVKPRDDDGADMPAATPEERERNKAEAHHLRVLEEADRIYLSRGGNPDTSEYDRQRQESEARRKAEEDGAAAPAEQPAAEPAK